MPVETDLGTVRQDTGQQTARSPSRPKRLMHILYLIQWEAAYNGRPRTLPGDTAAPLAYAPQTPPRGIAQQCHRPSAGEQAGERALWSRASTMTYNAIRKGARSSAMALSLLTKGPIWLSMLTETFCSCPLKEQYASSV
jgi:hypothetical protein